MCDVSNSPSVDKAMNPPPLIINAALTGVVPGKRDTPHVPISPDEIVTDAVRCLDAGAAIIHVHARDEYGNPSSDPLAYGEIIRRVRHERPEAILCATTTGRGGADLEQRAAVLNLSGDEKPDMASLALGSVDFPDATCTNPIWLVRELAQRMRENSILPELEIFHSGMVNTARMLMDKDIIATPAYCNFILGSAHMAQGTPGELAHLVSLLPGKTAWAAGGVGRFQATVTETALRLGGHVRVGLEDNIWLDRERKRLATNVELVERAVTLAGESGRKPATPEVARRMLGL